MEVSLQNFEKVTIDGNGCNNPWNSRSRYPNGDSGADTITGRAGADTLASGSKSDTFVFSSGDTGITLDTADTIADFSTGTIKLILLP